MVLPTGQGVGTGALSAATATVTRPQDTPPGPQEWAELVSAVLAEPERLRLVFQPIVGLEQAIVVGYEALARFDGPPALSPDRWFAAADAVGLGAELEALVVRRCLALRASLPPNCFLTMNVSPHLITHPVLTDLLTGAGSLAPLVLELTEHQAVDDLQPLLDLRDRLLGQGALLALDDAGAGYSGLQQMTQLRPHMIKLDRALVADADTDQVKLALAELLGEFAGRIDAWLLAEGIETWGELEAFLRLGVPLGQGYLLGRPGPPWAELDPQVRDRLRASAAHAKLVDQVASLVERVPLMAAGTQGPPPAGSVALRLDDLRHPVALLLPSRRELDDPGLHRPVAVSLRVASSTGVVELARRVAARPAHSRFDPVVVVDDLGQAVGVVRVEHLLLRLIDLQQTPSGA